MATHDQRFYYDLDPQLEPLSASEAADLRGSKARGIGAPVIDRRELDALRPYFFYLLALLTFLLSATSTVMQTRVLLTLMEVGWSPLATYGVGALLALVITLGELMTNESWWYLAFLVPDVALTVWWVVPALAAFTSNMGLPLWVAYSGALLLGTVSAYLPERVLLGSRRRGADQ